MAVVTITKGQIPLNGSVTIPDAVACGDDGAVVAFDAPDQKIMLIIGTATATIKKGNGLQGVADLTVTYVSNKQQAVVLESGKYMNMFGTHKGKVLITGATATVQAVVLP
jgi:hypothetical protein